MPPLAYFNPYTETSPENVGTYTFPATMVGVANFAKLPSVSAAPLRSLFHSSREISEASKACNVPADGVVAAGVFVVVHRIPVPIVLPFAETAMPPLAFTATEELLAQGVVAKGCEEDELAAQNALSPLPSPCT